MKRRTFLKALAVSPVVPSLLCAKEKEVSLFCGDLYCGEVNEYECTLRFSDPEFSKTRLTTYGVDGDGNFVEIATKLV